MYRVIIDETFSAEQAVATKKHIIRDLNLLAIVENIHPFDTFSPCNTLSLVTTERGDTLASYCFDTKRWYRYSDGAYVEGKVTAYKPLLSKEVLWEYPGIVIAQRMLVGQLTTGRYVIAYATREGGWLAAHNHKALRSDIQRITYIDNLKEGAWKS